MDERIIGLAARDFVTFIQTKNIQDLGSDDLVFLQSLLETAGFDLKEVVAGRLERNYLDNDGPTGERFAINTMSPVKVVATNGDDYCLATGWLDSLVRFVMNNAKEGMPQEELVKAVAEKIRQSRPLQPITLTAMGDQLVECIPMLPALSTNYFVTHKRDEDLVSGSAVGLHRYCNGFVDRHRATPQYDTLVCRACKLRVYIPTEAETFGDLRQALT